MTLQVQSVSLSEQLKKLVDAAFAQEISSEGLVYLPNDLARSLGIDLAYLSRWFALTEGRTLLSYIQGRRIDYVKERLVYSDDSVEQIARRTGFASHRQLTQHLTRFTGLTPSFFRQLRRQKLELAASLS